MGLKENVIIGQLIPAGTGVKLYNTINIDYEGMAEEDAPVAEVTELKEAETVEE